MISLVPEASPAAPDAAFTKRVRENKKKRGRSVAEVLFLIVLFGLRVKASGGALGTQPEVA